MKVIRYSKEKFEEWNNFLHNAKNQTFLFNRNFMEYHSDRFIDFSLMIYENNKLIALLPANIKDKTLYSHQGLTYGGFVFSIEEKLNIILKVVKETLKYLSSIGIEFIILKQMPRFYNTVGSDEVDYSMFILQAELFRRDVALCINLNNKLKYQSRRKRSIKKALKSGVEVKQLTSFDGFWKNILVPNLLKRFGVAPVHSLYEIDNLAIKFPSNIKQYNAYINDEIIAGCTIFETDSVAHAQYISASDVGRISGGLDLLFDYLINNVYKDKQYFDFGIVNENEGKIINHGLLDWKEGFGARSFSHDFYKVNTKNYVNLNKVIDD